MIHRTVGMTERGAHFSSPPARRRALTLMALTLAVAACSSATVNTDFDRGANFSNFRTYTWRTGTPARNQLMDKRIIAAIDSQLKTKGLTRVASNGDLFVTYHAAVGQELNIQTVNYGASYRCWGGCSQNTTVRPVNVGTLVVDLVDAKRDALVWRGTLSDAVSDNPDKTARTIHNGVQKMFSSFPPKT